MGDSYPVLLIILLAMFLITTPIIVQSNPSMVIRPHCTDKCGNISIPYPFGIEDGCYFDQRKINSTRSIFKIRCNHTTNPPTPIFGTNLEVLNISVVDGELRSTINASYECFNQSGYVDGRWDSLNLVSFTISSTKNILVAIGCDTYAWFKGIRGGQQYKAGCMTTCTDPEEVIDGECTGVGCCQSSIPAGVNNVTVDVFSLNNHTSVYKFNPCSVAYPVAKDAVTFHTKYLSRDLKYYNKSVKLPVVFNWTIGQHECSVAKANGSCLCKENTDCIDPEHERGYRCKCKQGYSGNPYLPRGCTDIDECKRENDCKKAEYCVNTIGSYYCKCPKGYHGNGTVTYPCISNEKPWLIPVLASVGVSVILGFVLLYIVMSKIQSVRLKRMVIKQRSINFERNGGLILQQLSLSDDVFTERMKIFTTDDLEKATDQFNENRILGKGGQGTVYKGMLGEGRIVAVKKSNRVEERGREEFINELVILSQINHRNILKVLGCCLETEVPILVYEFVSNGALSNHIHNPSEEFPITWKMRLQIASDTAGALSYLHSSTSTLIFHRDIKTSNILLDERYRAKLSDFGTSRSLSIDQTHVVTRVMGTFGYMDPEYFQTHQFTEKSDVYSFGVVLVELLTGQKAVRVACEEDKSLTSWFISHVENSCVLDIVDSQVLLEGAKEEFLAIVNLAKRCLNLDGKRRPTMKEVLLEIEGVLCLHMPQINDPPMTKSKQVYVGTSKSANSSVFSLESRVLDSAELSLLFNPR